MTIDNQQEDLAIDQGRMIAICKCLAAHYQILAQELIVHFVSETIITELHQKFFNDPTPTDVITFPIDEGRDPHGIWGELFICPKIAKEYADQHHLIRHKELELYLIHGILHLVGFNDIEETERQLMRAEEKKCIELLHLKVR